MVSSACFGNVLHDKNPYELMDFFFLHNLISQIQNMEKNNTINYFKLINVKQGSPLFEYNRLHKEIVNCKYERYHEPSSSSSLLGPGSLRQRDSFICSCSSWSSGTFVLSWASPLALCALLWLVLWGDSFNRLTASGGQGCGWAVWPRGLSLLS